jgi:hypothetical protein
MAQTFSSCIEWVVIRLTEPFFVVMFFAISFRLMRKSQREAMEERQQGHSPLSPSETSQTRTLIRWNRRWCHERNLSEAIFLWVASVADPLVTREEVIDFLLNGPKRYPRFRRRFTNLMLDLYRMAAETAPKDSTEEAVLKAFVQRLETVRASQFPE